MHTRLLAYEHAVNMTEIARWANELPGKEVPDAPGYRVVCVLRFQVIEEKEGYAALLLMEVTDKPPEDQIALKEEDVVVIEQLTSAIGEAPSEQKMLSEE